MRRPAVAWLLGLWAVVVGPPLFLRGAHFEEGTTIALARGAVEDGHWLTPHQYGERFVERPVLLSWTIAALHAPLGRVDPVLARLPTVLALLAGAWMLLRFVRRRASEEAGLLAAACFLVSPMVLQKTGTAEPDLLLSVLLFAAFAAWWSGFERGRVSPAGWGAIGALLGVAGWVKGPQPLGYFFLGVGAFLALRRRWRDLVGLAAAGAVAAALVLAWYAAVHEPGDLALWRAQSRIGLGKSAASHVLESARFVGRFLLESAPAVLLVVPAALGLRRRDDRPHRDLTVALLLYAACCTAVLVLWPGVRTRYAMPAVPALAAVAGLAFDDLRRARPRTTAAALLATAGLALYALVLGWAVMPIAPEQFRRFRTAGEAVASAVAAEPGTLHVLRENLLKNPLVHVPSPVRAVRLEELAAVPAPAWAMLTAAEAERLAALRPDARVRRVLDVPETDRVLVRILP